MSHKLCVKNGGRRQLLMIIFMLLPFSFAEAKPAWNAWVMYGEHLFKVDSQGTTLSEQKLPPVRRITPVVIAPNGTDAVFGIEGYPLQPAALLFYDMTANRIRRQYSLSGLPSSLTLNEYGTALALTLSSSDSWHIALIDLFTGKIIDALSWDSALFEAKRNSSALPSIRQYNQNRINFTLLTGEGYTWDTTTNRLDASPAFANGDGDILPQTSEVVLPLQDKRFPPKAPYNTLQVYEPLFASLHPFYSAAKPGLVRVWFIQGGERLLVKQTDNTWIVLERDGRTVGQWPAPTGLQIDDVHNIADGFLYTASLNSISLPEIMEVNTRTGLDAGQTIWNVPLDRLVQRFDAHEAFHLIWVNEPLQPAAFLNWAQLAEPISIATAEIPNVQPTPLPSLFPALTVGMEVQVQTVGGEILNLRRGPGRKFEIIRYLKNKERLFLLEGPKEVDGLSWWRVSATDGSEGWAVENDGKLQTLIPL
jgi:hypothetical protein